MSRTAPTTRRAKPGADRHDRESRRKSHPKAPKVTSDRAIYIGTVLVGFFFIVLAWLFTEGHWREPLVFYLAVVAFFINTAVLAIYRGKHLPAWQQSLARIPLRFVGFGTTDGKPLDAAHDQPATRTAALVSIIVSIIIVVGLGVLLIRVPS